MRREDFLAFLPKRYQMLAALGCRDAFLTALRETELGPAHLLAATEWRVETAPDALHWWVDGSERTSDRKQFQKHGGRG